MPSVERTITVDQPVEKVWEFMKDFRTTEQWDPPTVSTTLVSGNGGLGTTYHNVSRLLGKETHVDYTVVEYVEHERLQLRGDAGRMQLLDTITFEPTPTGTALTYHASFEPHGAAHLATPLLPAALKVLADEVEESLTERLRAL